MFENVGASVVYYNDGASSGLLIFFAFFWRHFFHTFGRGLFFHV